MPLPTVGTSLNQFGYAAGADEGLVKLSGQTWIKETVILHIYPKGRNTCRLDECFASINQFAFRTHFSVAARAPAFRKINGGKDTRRVLRGERHSTYATRRLANDENFRGVQIGSFLSSPIAPKMSSAVVAAV